MVTCRRLLSDHKQHRPRGKDPDAHQENAAGALGQNLRHALGHRLQVRA